MPTHRSHLPPLLWVVLLALVVRLPVAAWRWDSLSDDRDHYRLLADGLSNGRGLAHPDHGTPTAYRPPLYPLLLAGVSWSGAGQVGIVALHLLLGLVTVAGTWQTAIHLGLGHRAWWPAAAVGIDPLLVVGATLPMTETLFTALAVWMLAVATSTPSTRRGLTLGLLFGLAALCRPSVWAFAAVTVLLTLMDLFRKRTPQHWSRHRMAQAALIVGVAVTTGPWLVRNLSVSATPVLTTTHGGFTLLLGNNPVFYEQVVRRRLGTTWNDTTSDPGRTPADWRDSLEQRLGVPPQGVAAERKRDIKMYRLAMTNVADDPTGFLRACLLRVLRFWTPWPSESAPGSSWPVALKWAVAAWYAVTSLAMLRGLWSGPWRMGSQWRAPLLYLLAISLVHVVFWSTMRMRAPVMPIVFLLACVGLVRKPADAASGDDTLEAY